MNYISWVENSIYWSWGISVCKVSVEDEELTFERLRGKDMLRTDGHSLGVTI